MIPPSLLARTRSLLAVVVGLACLVCGPAFSATAPADSRPPNFVVILADDLGYGDLGCYGHPTIRTPRLDRMAAEGVRFTDFYSAAEVCTPSRAALLTGRYPVRSGMCHDRFRVLRRTSTGHLPANELTIAEVLATRDYATAIIGKWHLGVWANDPEGHPSRHGFDVCFGLPHSNDMDPAQGVTNASPASLEQDPGWWAAPLYLGTNLVERPADQTTLTARYTDEAIRFVRENKSRPFFLYLPHSFPHVPLFASPEFRGKSARGLYGDVVEELDANVGRLLDALRTEGLETNTLVVFTSDNGPWLTQGLAGGSAGLLREGKGSTWEGGMRVPAIARWPGRIPGGTICSEIASTLDLFPTLAKLAGAPLPADRILDGLDILPLLTSRGTVARDAFFYYRGTQLFAARVGPWKVHFKTQPAYGTPTAEIHDPPRLYHLGHDPGESKDVALAHPDVLLRIRAAVDTHLVGVRPAPTQLEATVAPTPPR